MPMIALTNADEISNAFHTLSQRLQEGAQSFARHVNWPGPDPGGNLHVYWHPNANLWALSDEVGGHHPGYWFGFGTVDPAHYTTLAPEMQLGLNREGTGRKCAGVFARDDLGHVYAMHKGQFQLNHQRISPVTFRQSHPDLEMETVHWTNGTNHEYFVLTNLNEPDLVARIGSFVNIVTQFKVALRAT